VSAVVSPASTAGARSPGSRTKLGVPERAEAAVQSFGFRHGAVDWRGAIDDPEVQVVFIAAPNRMHLELIW
jgi:predicted dehydrogenase